MTAKALKAALLMSAITLGGAVMAAGYAGQELEKSASVTIVNARAIALKAFPGKIKEEELEKEDGGSGLRFTFVIENGKIAHEVGVDAKTGDVLENAVEGPE